MNLILLLSVMVIPSTMALIDCRTACRTCRQRAVSPSELNIHCTMCTECKEKRREKLRGTTIGGEAGRISKGKNADAPHADTMNDIYNRMADAIHDPASHSPTEQTQYGDPHEYHDISYPHFNNPANLREAQPDPAHAEDEHHPPYPEGLYSPNCPTAPPCPGSEEEYVPELLLHPTERITVQITRATTTTTTTLRPCPPIRHCKRRRTRPPEFGYITASQSLPMHAPQYPSCLGPWYPPMMGLSGPCPYQPLALPAQYVITYKPPSVDPLLKPLNDLEATERPPRAVTTTAPPSATKGFFHVYVGVPKNVLNSY